MNLKKEEEEERERREEKIISSCKLNTHLSITGRSLDYYTEYVKASMCTSILFSLIEIEFYFQKFMFKYFQDRIEQQLQIHFLIIRRKKCL